MFVIRKRDPYKATIKQLYTFANTPQKQLDNMYSLPHTFTLYVCICRYISGTTITAINTHTCMHYKRQFFCIFCLTCEWSRTQVCNINNNNYCGSCVFQNNQLSFFWFTQTEKKDHFIFFILVFFFLSLSEYTGIMYSYVDKKKYRI